MEGKKKDLEVALGAVDKMESRFLKEQILASKRFQDRKDIVNAFLEEGELYTMKAVEEKIENYMKGKVK